MIQAAPFIALVVIFIASLWRGHDVSRSSGDNAWAFSSAKGKQRLAGLAFALSIIILAVASFLAIMQPVSGLAWVGLLLAVVGASIVIFAQIQMGRAWRVGVRAGDAPLFVQHGLFRFSRNPIFVGMIIVGLSIAVNTNSWWAWLALLTFVLTCYVQIRIEEAHLNQSFGDEYRQFCKVVPRWIGVLK